MSERNTILVVDDVEMNRVLLSEAFDKSFHVIEAENGKEALEKLEIYQDEVAAILLDIVMPVMSGFDVLDNLAARGLLGLIPVFLITAESSEKVLLHGYEMGVADVINKPFNLELVNRRVCNVIELFHTRRQLRIIVDEQEIKLEAQAKKLQETNSAIIDTLSTVIEFRDCESGDHVLRIRSLTTLMLTHIVESHPEFGVAHEDIPAIADAAVMHDVGKISIPDYILNKPGRLTKEEFDIMKEHTINGCAILESIPRIRESEIYSYSYDICRHHHERWDGRGYPDGLKGEELSIWVQVVALADVYDALVSDRVYKPAYSHEEATRMILAGECGAFSPVMQSVFLEMADTIHKKLYQSHPVTTVEAPRYERRKTVETAEKRTS